MLRTVVGLMLVGHGGFGAFMAKPNLLSFYQAVGFDRAGYPLETLRTGIGFFEISLGLTALRLASPTFLGFVFLWKVGSELLYPISGANMGCWEFIERGGSYVAPLALLCLTRIGDVSSRDTETNPGPPAS
jgi:hypothetical protein